jgi:hypothetical protein
MRLKSEDPGNPKLMLAKEVQSAACPTLQKFPGRD